MDPIYLDNNATTPLLPAVWEAMAPYALQAYGNPASAHSFGRKARRALEDARERVAVLLDAHADEVIFTSGATEANNFALLGAVGPASHRSLLPKTDEALVLPRSGGEGSAPHLLASPLEHPSVVEPLAQLVERGFALNHLPVSDKGIIVDNVLVNLLRPETCLVAVQLVNHEMGAIQPIAALARGLPPSVRFHCDATQAVGKLPVRFHELGVTSLALSAHKFHGPKGIGALLLRRGTSLTPRTFGGHQQQGRRPGTEPVALVVGLAAALDLAISEMQIRFNHVLTLRLRLLDALRRGAAPVVLNGPESEGVPHCLNLSFPSLRADLLLMRLDLAGVLCSAGSACSSGSLLPSPVLRALRLPEELLTSAVRLSLSPLLTIQQIDEAAYRICQSVNDLRRASASALR
jgi:cysteine desulfurase